MGKKQENTSAVDDHAASTTEPMKNGRGSTGFTPTVTKWSTSQKHDLSDQRRLESIKKRLEDESNAQKIIKEALSSKKHGAPNKKIHFDSDGEYEEDDHTVEQVVHLDESATLDGHKKKKKKRRHSEIEIDSEDGHSKQNKKSDRENGTSGVTFFDDESSDSQDDLSTNFQFKKQFEGEAGQKLLELQGRFGNDKRFKIDERFKEDSASDAENSNVSGGEGDDQQVEKSRNFNILQSVLGYEIAPTEKRKSKSSSKAWNGEISRYDPTREDAAELEVNKKELQEEPESTKSARKKKKHLEDVQEIDLPVVSEERFYEVKSSLADMFAKKDKPFTLGSTFELSEDVIDKEKGIFPVGDQSKLKTRSNWDRNPFKYDSSSDEDDDAVEAIKTDATPGEGETNIPSTLTTISSEPTTKRDSFFFLKDDKRLKDGIEFFRRRDDEETMRTKWEANLVPLLEFLRKNKRKALKKVKSSRTSATPKQIPRFKTLKKKVNGKKFK